MDVRNEAPVVWAPCGHCWGQGRLYEPVAAEGDGPRGLVPVSCPACIGVGQTIRMPGPGEPAELRPPARRSAAASPIRWWAAGR